MTALPKKVPVRVSDRLAAWVERALAKHAPGEAAMYEVGLVSTPNGMQHYAAVWLPGALIGSLDTSALLLAGAHAATEEQIDHTVLDMVESMRRKRSADLAASALPDLGGMGRASGS